MVSIIILSYNTESLLSDCLQSVFSVTKGEDAEVIVVDNASSDQSVAMVRKDFPQVKLIANKTNVGFSKGSNIGAKHAKGEFLCFLNSDTLLTSFVTKKIDSLFEDAKVGVVGGILENEEKTRQRSYGSYYFLPQLFAMLFFGDNGKEISLESKQETVDWVSGGFMITRRELFERLSGFDETFFMYIEDMEFCYRVHKIDLAVLYDSSFRAIHKEQGSSNRDFAITQIYTGIVIFYQKHLPSQVTIAKFFLLAKAYMVIVYAFVTRNPTLKQRYQKAVQFDL